MRTPNQRNPILANAIILEIHQVEVAAEYDTDRNDSSRYTRYVVKSDPVELHQIAVVGVSNKLHGASTLAIRRLVVTHNSEGAQGFR